MNTDENKNSTFSDHSTGKRDQLLKTQQDYINSRVRASDWNAQELKDKYKETQSGNGQTP